MFVCLAAWLFVSSNDVSGRLLNLFIRKVRAGLVEEGESEFREEEFGLTQVFPLTNLGKEVLKLKNAFLEGLTVLKCRIQKTNPNGKLSVAVKIKATTIQH